jgi:hypothetical protein
MFFAGKKERDTQNNQNRATSAETGPHLREHSSFEAVLGASPKANVVSRVVRPPKIVRREEFLPAEIPLSFGTRLSPFVPAILECEEENNAAEAERPG